MEGWPALKQGESVSGLSRKVRVLFILPSLHAGGAEHYVLRLIRVARSGAFEWHVLSPSLERGDLHEAFEAEGAKVRYQSIGYFNPLKMLGFYRYVREGRFDVVCTLNGVFGGLTLAIGNAAGAKSRIGWHRRSTPAFKPTWGRRAYSKMALWLLEKNSTRVLSNGRAALDHFHGVDWVNDDRFGVIPNGVDAGPFLAHRETSQEARKVLGIPGEGYVVGHVARYDPAKNHETIFRVARELIRQEPTATFVFCGKGTDSSAFRERLEHYGIADHCIALGLQPNLPRVYRSFDVFYFPSVTEGQPNALIEAMLAGIPVVASDITPIRDMVPPELEGALIPPCDVGLAVARIAGLIEGQRQDVELTRRWAMCRFDPATNFGMFLEELKA